MIVVNSYRNSVPQYSFSSIQFDGVNEYALRGTAGVGYRTADTAGTISAWIKVTNGAAFQIVWAGGDSTKFRNVNLSMWENKLYFRSRGGGTDNVMRSTATITDGVWTHIAASSDGAAYKLWINGVSTAFTVFSGVDDGDWFSDSQTSLNYVDISMGAWRISGVDYNYFTGKIDDVLIHNIELSAAQMLSLYNGGKPTNPFTHSASANLVASWLFDGDVIPGANAIIEDSNAANMTSTNMEAGDIQSDVP